MTNQTTYGAAESHHPNGTAQHTSNHIASEEDALLGSEPRKPRPTSWRHHLTTPVTSSHADLVLLLCYIITGLLDASATIIWGAFVSMQTGNSIYVGLGIVDPYASNRWIKSLASISAFCLGSFFFSRFHRLFSGSPKRRWSIAGSFTLQALMIVASALILHFTASPEPGDEHDLHWHVLVPIALIAGQSGGQTASSRALQWNSLTSTVLTSVYCDLWSDQKLFSGLTANAERNRRIAAPILLVVGSMMGALWSKSEYGLEGALWMAAGMKSVIVVVWLLWKEEKQDQ